MSASGPSGPLVSETTWPIETNFHMTTFFDWLAKIYTNCYGHMTKMATTSIYFNIIKKIRSSSPHVPPICLLILSLWFLFFHVLLCVPSSFAIILTRKMELAALFSCSPDV